MRDKVAEEYAPPYLARTDGMAVRAFAEITTGQKITYAADLELYRIGDYDISTGVITPCTPVLIDTAKEE